MHKDATDVVNRQDWVAEAIVDVAARLSPLWLYTSAGPQHHSACAPNAFLKTFLQSFLRRMRAAAPCRRLVRTWSKRTMG